MLDHEFIAKLKKAAQRETWDDDAENFNPHDHSGGNFDDAYFHGQEDGETHLAREILTGLNISWDKN